MTRIHFFELVFFIVPWLEVAVGFVVGRLLRRRSERIGSPIGWSIGVALSWASVIGALVVAWLFYEYYQTYGFGRLALIWIVAGAPGAFMGAGTILFSALFQLWGYFRPDFFAGKGMPARPGPVSASVSGAVVTVAAGMFLYAALPSIHRLPYTALFGGTPLKPGRFTNPHRQLIGLSGHNFISGKYEQIIVLRNDQWPEYTASFRLDLDWRGRVRLQVRHVGSRTRAETTATYFLPFKFATYRLVDGKPVRVENP